jgi:hypothetical protein
MNDSVVDDDVLIYYAIYQFGTLRNHKIKCMLRV